MNTYFVYILTNKNNTVLYTGFTDDIVRRVDDHKRKEVSKSFTSRYNCDKLVYFESFELAQDAILREKQLKRYKREWKENLINTENSEWKDLSIDWYD
jgi:putative endonuclease